MCDNKLDTLIINFSTRSQTGSEPVDNDPPPQMFEVLHNMLGPPPDESILAGLQSFFRILGIVSTEKHPDASGGINIVFVVF